MFHLPLSQQAYDEFLELEVICQEAREHSQEGSKDLWTYIWGNSEFSSNKACNAMVGYQATLTHFNWIWDSSCQSKHKLFFWLLLHDSLNTRNFLARKQFQLQSYNCATLQCPQEETRIHLFWTCPLLKNVGTMYAPKEPGICMCMKCLQMSRTNSECLFHGNHDTGVIRNWMVRNNKIFKNQAPRFASWKPIYLKELALLNHMMKKKHAQKFKDWPRHKLRSSF